MLIDNNLLHDSLEFIVKHEEEWKNNNGFLDVYLADGSYTDRIFKDEKESILYIQRIHIDGYLDSHLEAVNDNLIRNRYELNANGRVFYHSGGYKNLKAEKDYRRKTSIQMVRASWALVILTFFAACYYLIEIGKSFNWW